MGTGAALHTRLHPQQVPGPVQAALPGSCFCTVAPPEQLGRQPCLKLLGRLSQDAMTFMNYCLRKANARDYCILKPHCSALHIRLNSSHAFH